MVVRPIGQLTRPSYVASSMRTDRSGHEPAPPSVASVAGACERCGHARFVHADTGDRACLYNECGCSDRWTNVRVLRSEPKVQRRDPPPRPDTVSLIARRAGSIIAVALTRSVAAERAERLASSVWEVQLEERAGEAT